MDFAEHYCFQVWTWLPGTGRAQSLFERGRWIEMARCSSQQHAEEIAVCLSLRHPSGVRVSQWVTNEDGSSRFVPFKFLPPSASTLR